MIKNCPHCGASLQYQAEQATVACEFCNSTIQLIDWESKKVLDKAATTERISVLRSQKEIFTKSLRSRREKREALQSDHDYNLYKTKKAHNAKYDTAIKTTKICGYGCLGCLIPVFLFFFAIFLIGVLAMGELPPFVQYDDNGNKILGSGAFCFIPGAAALLIWIVLRVILKFIDKQKLGDDCIEKPSTLIQAEQDLISLESKIRAIDEEIVQLMNQLK
jgi:uncharacterized Zn finger protein (UPF0148 family)